MKLSFKADRILLVVVALLICGYLIWSRQVQIQEPSTRGASFSLKVVASAEADFLANDLDGNGVNDYWSDDLAGLYLVKGRTGKMIELIPRSAALADDRPRSDTSELGSPSQLRGYWYRAILHAGEAKSDRKRFAYCGFRGEGNGGRSFIIDEGNVMWWKDLGGRCADNFPVDLEKEGWRKVD